MIRYKTNDLKIIRKNIKQPADEEKTQIARIVVEDAAGNEVLGIDGPDKGDVISAVKLFIDLCKDTEEGRYPSIIAR